MMGWTPATASTRTLRASTSCARQCRAAGASTTCWKTTCVPSGVSYMLEDRKMMMRLFPELFSQHRAPVAHYPTCCWRRCAQAAWPPRPRAHGGGGADAGHVQQRVLRARLPAQQDGRGAGRGQDLFVKDDFVYMRTTRVRAVDVIYRRVDDDFPRPAVFRPIPRPGLRRPAGGLPRRQRDHLQRHRHRRGRRQVDLPLRAADDRVLPGRKPILNNVPTWMCRKPDDLQYVLDNLKDLVVKEVHGAGGYGMLVGPAATRPRSRTSRQALQANPGGYIAQPTLSR